MKKTNVGTTVFAALIISSFAALFAGNQAHAASYAGPVYSSYNECEAARPSFQSSFTRASQCSVAYAYDTNTDQNVYIGYSFNVTTQ